MSLRINRNKYNNPKRILIVGPSASGKTWFANRLAKWLHTFLEIEPVEIDSQSIATLAAPFGCVITTTNQPAATSEEQQDFNEHYDWVFNFSERASGGDRCSACGGRGITDRKFKIGRDKVKNLHFPCDGHDCIMRVWPVSEYKDRVPAPSILDQMAKRRADDAEGAQQLNAVRRAVKPDIAKDDHIPSILAADIAFGIDRLATDLDVVLTALNTGLPLNDSAKASIRSHLVFDFQRLRSQFGGLKALILQEGEQHQIINDQVRGAKTPDLMPSPF